MNNPNKAKMTHGSKTEILKNTETKQKSKEEKAEYFRQQQKLIQLEKFATSPKMQDPLFAQSFNFEELLTNEKSKPNCLELEYDRDHGDAHFTRAKSNWYKQQSQVNPSLEDCIRKHTQFLLDSDNAEKKAFYIRDEASKENQEVLIGYDKLNRCETTDFTIQLERKPTSMAQNSHVFYYHGYPDARHNSYTGIAENKSELDKKNKDPENKPK